MVETSSGAADPTAWPQVDDPAAFAAFYARHEGVVFRTALGMTRDASVAEEVVTDTFLRAYIARGTLDPARSPVPWLQKVAINLCVNRLRRRRLPSQPLDDVTAHAVRDRDPSRSPEHVTEQHEAMEALLAGIARLKPRQRAVIVLRFLHDYSLAQIAETLDEPLGTVKSRLHGAVHALRDDLNADLRARENLAGLRSAAVAPVDLDTEVAP
ncbi:MAG: RNA polymerase sigma factor [Candidatus Limnocylindrales bacterium]